MRLLICLIFFLIIAGCDNSEQKANSLYIKATIQYVDGNNVKALKLYNEIVTKYPNTSVGVKAIDSIVKVKDKIKQIKDRKEKVLIAKNTFLKAKDCFVQHKIKDAWKHLNKACNKYAPPYVHCYKALKIYYGIGCKQNINDAKKIFLKYKSKLFKSKDHHSYFIAGWIHHKGLGEKVNYKKAFELYELSAQENNQEAMNYLAGLYESGKGTVKDSKKAISLYKEAAVLGSVDAMFFLGMEYESRKDKKESFKWYKKAAEKGQIESMHAVGYMYDYGKGVAIDDVKAVEWYKRAALKGNLRSLYNLALMYEYGEGVKKDKIIAWKLYCKGADLGYKNSIDKIKNYKVKCQQCNGNGTRGTVRCYRCSGRGKVYYKCSTCRGSCTLSCDFSVNFTYGFIRTFYSKWRCRSGRIYETCEAKDGGSVSPRYRECYYSGTKLYERMTCPKCNGRGARKCWNCYGSGTRSSSCSVCNSKGQLKRKCYKCNGAGKIKLKR